MKSSITYCKSLMNDNSVEFMHFSLGAISMTPGKGYYTVPEGGQKISNHPGWGYLTALGERKMFLGQLPEFNIEW